MSALFLTCAVYAQGYLARRQRSRRPGFVGGLLVLLAAVTTVALSQHLGLLWVAIEVTTLSTAPLIYFNRNERVARGGLEVPGRLLRRHRDRARRHLPARARVGRPRRAAHAAGGELVAGGARSRSRGCAPPSSSCSPATGPRWGSRRSTPGSRTRTARRRGCSGALLSGGVTAVAFLALVRVLQRLHRRRGEGAFARQGLVAIGVLSLAARGRLPRPAAGLQADAGVLERGAHGDPRARRRHRRRSGAPARSCT